MSFARCADEKTTNMLEILDEVTKVALLTHSYIAALFRTALCLLSSVSLVPEEVGQWLVIRRCAQFWAERQSSSCWQYVCHLHMYIKCMFYFLPLYSTYTAADKARQMHFHWQRLTECFGWKGYLVMVSCTVCPLCTTAGLIALSPNDPWWMSFGSGHQLKVRTIIQFYWCHWKGKLIY